MDRNVPARSPDIVFGVMTIWIEAETILYTCSYWNGLLAQMKLTENDELWHRRHGDEEYKWSKMSIKDDKELISKIIECQLGLQEV